MYFTTKIPKQNSSRHKRTKFRAKSIKKACKIAPLSAQTYTSEWGSDGSSACASPTPHHTLHKEPVSPPDGARPFPALLGRALELCEIRVAYLLRSEITKSHLNNHICQHCGMKTSTVTPSFYYVFNVSSYCNVNIPIYGGFFY